MNEKILLNCDSISDKIKYDAGSKPRNDITKIFTSNGFIEYNLIYKLFIKNKIFRIISFLFQYFTLLTKLLLNKTQLIVIQYPYYFPSSIAAINLLCKVKKKAYKVIFIHDINSLRINGVLSKEEEDVFNRVDCLIVHTQKMKEVLWKNNIKPEIKILGIFDYLSNSKNFYQDMDKFSIVFAGNLQKSTFISKIPSDFLKNLFLYLYGVIPPKNYDKNFSYEGKFNPDDIENIKGFWGLVWDGDSVETCSGNMGEYLKFNASHKISLYLAAEKPVIIWEKSAMKDFVLNYNLGFCINSIDEIYDKIVSFSEKELFEIKKSVKEFACYLRKGNNTKKIIKSLNIEN